jgi:hypothetical protein
MQTEGEFSTKMWVSSFVMAFSTYNCSCLRPWRWWKQVPQNHQYPAAKLYGPHILENNLLGEICCENVGTTERIYDKSQMLGFR